MKNLVIVESPSKSKTIEKYLGNDYKVLSSQGHIRDLATSGKYGLGVDVDNDFKPNYQAIRGKKKIITELKKAIKEADKVYLATDPDREGEAISWHLMDELKIKDDDYYRVLFHEITKDKVIEAINNPGKIDFNLVKSQETRRILDRIIGFRLSKLMQSKTGGSSAGRVQSVALKLIVDREREIAEFIKEEYYTITAKFKDFDANLYEYNNEKIELKSEKDADYVISNLNKEFNVSDIQEKEKAKKSKLPFTTSTLQQEASLKLGFPAKKTMSIAQKLYEGIKLDEGPVGLITYMRTDSVRLSLEFTGSAKNYINNEYGKEYVGYVREQKEKDNVQDAHEAIRPTSVYRTPLSVKKFLTDDEYKLYKFIYVRALSSLMSDAKQLQTTIILDNNNYKFKASGSVLIFDGYLRLYKDYEDNKDNLLPKITDKILYSEEIIKEQHFTQPPARYNEAKLIKEMEELGIGRPSTYVTIISNIKDRNYVNIVDKKFVPTETGFEVTDKLQEFFSDIINVEYTANMENDLDKIATENVDNIKVLSDFYNIFEPKVKNAFNEMEKAQPKETGEMCPECGKPLVIRKGKFGEFTACSNYPECKYIKKKEVEVKEICDCPVCKVGKMVEKKSKKGKVFYGCSNYPKCKTATWDLPINELCPKCSSILTNVKDKIKCSNKDCDYER